MTKVILVRHGQTVWNKVGRYQGQADIELSDLGREQAEYLANNFPADHIDGVYASPLERAMDTAAAVAKKFRMAVVPCDEFKEIFFGKWEGLTYEEIHRDWADLHDDLFNKPDELRCPSGEGFMDVQARAVKKLEQLVKQHEGQTIVIAAHGGVNRTMLCHVLGMPLRNMWRIRQDNTAVNIISFFENGKINVEVINSTAHLSGDSKLMSTGVFGFNK